MSTLTKAIANGNRGFPFILDEFFTLDDFFPISYSQKADIKYENDKTTLDLNLAGTAKENLNVEVKGKSLIIESTQEGKELKKSYEIPDDIDSENMLYSK